MVSERYRLRYRDNPSKDCLNNAGKDNGARGDFTAVTPQLATAFVIFRETNDLL